MTPPHATNPYDNVVTALQERVFCSCYPQVGGDDLFMRRRLLTVFVAAVLLAASQPQTSHAQPFPKSERQKATEAGKAAADKATDEAYKATMKRTPDVKKPIDPWGGIRAPEDSNNK